MIAEVEKEGVLGLALAFLELRAISIVLCQLLITITNNCIRQ